MRGWLDPWAWNGLRVVVGEISDPATDKLLQLSGTWPKPLDLDLEKPLDFLSLFDLRDSSDLLVLISWYCTINLPFCIGLALEMGPPFAKDRENQRENKTDCLLLFSNENSSSQIATELVDYKPICKFAEARAPTSITSLMSNFSSVSKLLRSLPRLSKFSCTFHHRYLKLLIFLS